MDHELVCDDVKALWAAGYDRTQCVTELMQRHGISKIEATCITIPIYSGITTDPDPEPQEVEDRPFWQPGCAEYRRTISTHRTNLEDQAKGIALIPILLSHLGWGFAASLDGHKYESAQRKVTTNQALDPMALMVLVTIFDSIKAKDCEQIWHNDQWSAIISTSYRALHNGRGLGGYGGSSQHRIQEALEALRDQPVTVEHDGKEQTITMLVAIGHDPEGLRGQQLKLALHPLLTSMLKDRTRLKPIPFREVSRLRPRVFATWLFGDYILANPRARHANIKLVTVFARLGRFNEMYKTAGRLARYASHRAARFRGVIEALQGLPTSLGKKLSLQLGGDLLVFTAV